MKEHIIFALVKKIIEEKDELINKDFHFIQTGYECDGSENELKKSYRVYHKRQILCGYIQTNTS